MSPRDWVIHVRKTKRALRYEALCLLTQYILHVLTCPTFYQELDFLPIKVRSDKGRHNILRQAAIQSRHMSVKIISMMSSSRSGFVFFMIYRILVIEEESSDSFSGSVNGTACCAQSEL